ncbi:uncharacterized protein LOC110685409 [Chenopodium quinoa]|uniref:uncharacterized protein LOC110685409 n=1 Tax=Chenopodium quinoa TaxID=63459 RepID=UPI000B790D7D|nr:uncharacterized protein LOC110685409 [Chenopodium quinoa]
MAEFIEALFYDVDQILTEETMVEIYYDQQEEMQDEDLEQYETENENMQEEEEENGQQCTQDVHIAHEEDEDNDMQTERSYVAVLKISHVTLHNLKKKGRLRTHISSNKPTLTLDHKVARIKWVLSHINPLTSNEDPTFVDMNHVIHINEKWFYLNSDKRRFYLLPKEEDPYRTQQSRRFKFKPLYDRNGELLHDGKYGIFPFTVNERAKKSSKNRAASTWETKTLQNVNREVIREMLPTKPAQSPDLNVLDLGLFRSIQSLQYLSFPCNLDELVEKVIESYDTFNPKVNKYIWVTLQRCMIKILKGQGWNKYKIPHMNKNKLENLGILPDQVKVKKEIVMEAVEYLNTMFRPANQGNQDAAEDMEVDAD